MSFISHINAQSIVPWTEQNGTLGLGYPVPIPVDTPEAFDGFRTYDGLFSKHQSLAFTNDYITGHIVGQTRNNRDIWAYILSDEDNTTKYGIKEGAMLINGNIHAREWQTPEVMTGIMELLDANSADLSLHQYLLENTSIVVIPVNNVDGLLQTQRYPEQNVFTTSIGVRDGRMRRKNMLDVDENLSTFDDYLLGVDLNRNNNPYWASSNSSSFSPQSIVYHGPSSQSEPETQARITAAHLVDDDQIRIYTDVHSYSKVHFSVRTDNSARTTLMHNLLQDFSNHHVAFPANKYYQDSPSGPGSGIGSTDEYFALTYEVPSWTLEVEPGGGAGTEYGGFGNDGHDGFILPESHIKRVREQLSQTFMVAWYEQSGPPSITNLKIVENESTTGVKDTLIDDLSWDIQGDGSRVLYHNEVRSLIIGNTYRLIIGFDKPMRVRNEQGAIAHLQGQGGYDLDPNVTLSIGNDVINGVSGSWVNEKNESIISYNYYKDDTYVLEFTIPENITFDDNVSLSISIDVADMVGQKLDANPATVVTWANGQWQNYENDSGENSLLGGSDNSYLFTVKASDENDLPITVLATGLYFDPTRSGEGFSYELLSESKIWLQWFTYDNSGKQRWYSALGSYKANTIYIENLSQGSGGIFGNQFDSENISYSDFGSLEIIFTSPVDDGNGNLVYSAKALFKDVNGKKLRTEFKQITRVLGALPSIIIPPPSVTESKSALISGSWYNQNRSGEGYIIEVLVDNTAVVLWYTYDLDGNLMWLLDSGGTVTVDGDKINLDFDSLVVTEGGVFGAAFNADDVNRTPWGELHFSLSCSKKTGTLNYTSSINGFGSGEYSIVQLTHPLIDSSYNCDQ